VLATSGPWFDRRRPENSWPSVAVSIVVTSGLFVSAFLAMQTVGRWTGARSEPAEPPVIVRLAPPPVVIERPRPASRPRKIPAPRTSAPNPEAPPAGEVAAPVGVGAQVTTAPTAPSAKDPPRTDTAAAKGPAIPRGPIAAARSGSDVPYETPAGVGGTPSGVTIGSRTANTQAYRDSVLTGKLKTFAEMAAAHPPTGAELAALEQSKQVGLRMARRATTAGNAEVHTMLGEGVGGEGAVGGSPLIMSGGKSSSSSAKEVARAGGGSIALPFLSSGPSTSQRKKNEALDRDYQARLRRLEDRMALKRDSLRRDSLRLDSLRRDSLGKRRP